jgi:aryl-alcohol dehydrogenase-like predicted oxidoreductase
MSLLGYRSLTLFAELNCTITQLALAWVAANPNTSTVILGASKPEQILDNLKAIEVLPKLTPAVLDSIDEILDNKPAAPNTYGRQALDPTGRKWY